MGGAGAIREFTGANALAISQPTELHEDIAALLTALRALKAAQPPVIASADSGTALPMFTCVYHLRKQGFGSAGFPLPPDAARTSGDTDAPSAVEPVGDDSSLSHASLKPTPDELADVIRQSVEPRSWRSTTDDGKEASLSVVGDALVIRQTGAAHSQILSLLRSLGMDSPYGLKTDLIR